MKTITLQQALDLLRQSIAVSIDGVLTRSSTDQITGNPDNWFATIDDLHSDGEYSMHAFTEGDNYAPRLENSTLILHDDSGEDVEIVLLAPMVIPPAILSPYKTYDVTLKGFDGSTDRTDDLVKWVNSPSLEAVNAFVARLGFPLHGKPSVAHEVLVAMGDGVDVILNDEGKVIQGSTEGWAAQIVKASKIANRA